VIRSKTRGVLVGRVSFKISLLRPSGRVLGVEALKEALADPLLVSRSVCILLLFSRYSGNAMADRRARPIPSRRVLYAAAVREVLNGSERQNLHR
jgi:hypothetical protein